MELNPFEWGLPWYYYSIGGIILVFSIVFIVIYISSRSKEDGSPRWPKYWDRDYTPTKIGKENSSKNTFSQNSEEYRKWKEGEED